MTTPNNKQAGERTQYTPGPWITDEEHPVIVICEDDHTIVIAKCGHESNSFAKRNARLIAAAPELLEVTKLARQYIQPGSAVVIEMLDAAIAKAEGH